MSKVSITKSKLDALATAVSAKSGVATPITIDGMTAAVTNIQTGDNTFVITLIWNDQTEMWEPNKTFAEIQAAWNAGKVIVVNCSTGIYEMAAEGFYVATGDGSFEYTVWRYQTISGESIRGTVLQAYRYNAYGLVRTANVEFPELNFQSKTVTPTESQQTVTYDTEDEYNGLSSVTVNAIPSSYVGSGITRRSSSDLLEVGANVVVPKGYYENNAVHTMTTGSATPASSISATGATVSTGTNTLTLSKTVSNTPQVTMGYVAEGTAGNSSVSLTASVTTQAAQTIYPSTSDQTITGSKYLTGTQTIKGVAVSNTLTADNIKNGVTITIGDSADADRITSVTGTYTGGGGGVNIDTKTVTASNRPSSLSFTSMKGEPKVWFLKATFTMTSSSSTYYYVDSMRYNGTNTTGRLFRMGSTRQTENVASGYSFTYSGTTLTVSSTGTRTASPGCFYNGSYELVYVY